MGDFRENKAIEPSNAMPPTFSGLADDLKTMIETRWSSRKKPFPACVPGDPYAAIDWFIKMMPGQKPYEAVRQTSTVKGTKFWIWPYADRMKYLARKFFDADTDLQNFVIAARQDRIEWRGDDMKTFLMIIEETEEMHRIGVDAYRKKIRPPIRELIMKMHGKVKQDQKSIEENRQEAMAYVESQS
jgi:hypothetical protein